jgi:hypothetical protein
VRHFDPDEHWILVALAAPDAEIPRTVPRPDVFDARKSRDLPGEVERAPLNDPCYPHN